MSPYQTTMAAAFREALCNGAVETPHALVTLVSSFDTPIDALLNPAQSVDIFASLQTTFPFLSRLRNSVQTLSDQEFQRLASSFRWLIRGLRDWQTCNDSKGHTLAAYIALVEFVGGGPDWWDAFPDEIAENANLARALARLVTASAVQFSTRAGDAAPIWEREAVDKLHQTDRDGDWFGFVESLKPFEAAIKPNILQKHSIRILARFWPHDAADAVGRVAQAIAVLPQVGALTTGRRLQLAVTSNIERVRFCCAYITLQWGQAREPLAEDETELLRQLLIKAAEDPDEWKAWMKVFNAHPVRFPTLQMALGRSLAAIPEDAIKTYVDSVELFPFFAKEPNEGRQRVAECLRAFRASASKELQYFLWRTAFARWLAWGFRDKRQDNSLTQLVRSELDYAVTAYLVDCIEENERVKQTDAIRLEIQELANRWHTSETDGISAWNRLLSKLQPYAHASSVISSSQDFLAETRTYLPDDKKQNTYWPMMWRS